MPFCWRWLRRRSWSRLRHRGPNRCSAVLHRDQTILDALAPLERNIPSLEVLLQPLLVQLVHALEFVQLLLCPFELVHALLVGVLELPDLAKRKQDLWPIRRRAATFTLSGAARQRGFHPEPLHAVLLALDRRSGSVRTLAATLGLDLEFFYSLIIFLERLSPPHRLSEDLESLVAVEKQCGGIFCGSMFFRGDSGCAVRCMGRSRRRDRCARRLRRKRRFGWRA
mmetsp:Transcript_44569/g.123474  ORF Transcript_44569/g.123474 Transcript_44569/m.123474 type:complete len:225 (+) Transcript_44569:591-1265(+)